jgi:hypothetical protein
VAVVSVDLAYKSYTDVGAVVLRNHSDHVCGELLPIPLAGPPSPVNLARFLNQYCADVHARVLMLDGPQAWRAVDSASMHSRACERELNTPAKTGLPGFVKPANYRKFVAFSVEMFDALCSVGWTRLTHVGAALQPNSRVAIESFPLSAWHSLGIAPLPSKQKTRSSDFEPRLLALEGLLPLHLSGRPTHDQLQAVVSGLAGLAVERNAWTACAVAGLPPFVCDGYWREGFIVNATHSIADVLSRPRSGATVD